jgi:hypothetical protein
MAAAATRPRAGSPRGDRAYQSVRSRRRQAPRVAGRLHRRHLPSTCSTHTRAISRGINRSATNYTPTSAASSRNALTRESASTISASCRSADASPGNSYKIKPLPLTIGAFFVAFETKRGLYSPHRRTNRFTVGVLPAPLSPVARICGSPPDTIACYCVYRRMKPF